MTSPRDLPSGRFAGRYELGEVLGRGGFATVVRAQDLNLRREVALKVATRADLDKRRWERELAAMMRLGALGVAHVPPVYDVGLCQGFDYFTMPLYRGGSLEQRIKAHGPLSVEEAVSFLDGLADLDRAHADGWRHRDIKPSNVAYVEPAPTYGSFALIDWGIAQHADDETLTDVREVVGTRRYLSPQRLNGERATASDDRYAAARTVEDMLTGYSDGRAADELAGMPARLAQVLDRATDPDPRAQYESMSVMAIEFAAAAAPLSGTRRRVRTAATRVQHTASDSFAGLRDRMAGLEDELKQSRGEAQQRRREHQKMERALSEVRRAQEGTSRELSGVRRSMSIVEAAMARFSGMAQQNDAVVEEQVAASGGGPVRTVFGASPPSPEAPSDYGKVADFAEFARKRRGRGTPYLSDVSATSRAAGQRARQVAGSAGAASRKAAPYAHKYGTVLMLIAIACGAAALWIALSARLPTAVVGSLRVRENWAGPLTWASVVTLMLAAGCRTASAGLYRRTDAAAIAVATSLGVAALIVGYHAHEHTTSPWLLAPGQWYVIGVCLLALAVMRSSQMPPLLSVALLTVVLAATIPVGSLVLALWVLAGAGAVVAPMRFMARRRRPAEC